MFALAPALTAVAIAAASGRLGPLGEVAPLVVLSGLAVITAAGDRVLLYRERLVSSAWVGILVVPPLVAVAGIAVMPWIASVDPKVAQPAEAEGRFFAETFQRRTGKPLQYVAGDQRLAPLVALAAPSRPHVYFDWAPKWSPWATPADMQQGRRRAGLAGDRRQHRAAGEAESAIPLAGAGSAALVRAPGAGLPAVHPPRLGGAAAAGRQQTLTSFLRPPASGRDRPLSAGRRRAPPCRR